MGLGVWHLPPDTGCRYWVYLGGRWGLGHQEKMIPYSVWAFKDSPVNEAIPGKTSLAQNWGHIFHQEAVGEGAGRVEQQNLEEKMPSVRVFSFLEGSNLGLLCQTWLWVFWLDEDMKLSPSTSLGGGFAGVSQAACDLLVLIVSLLATSRWWSLTQMPQSSETRI